MSLQSWRSHQRQSRSAHFGNGRCRKSWSSWLLVVCYMGNHISIWKTWKNDWYWNDPDSLVLSMGVYKTNRTQTTSTRTWPIDPKTVRADPFLHGQTLEILHFLHSFYIFNFSPLDSGWVSDPQGLGSHKASHHPGLKTVFSHHLDLSWKNAIMIDKILTMKGLVVSSPLMTDELL